MTLEKRIVALKLFALLVPMPMRTVMVPPDVQSPPTQYRPTAGLWTTLAPPVNVPEAREMCPLLPCVPDLLSTVQETR